MSPVLLEVPKGKFFLATVANGLLSVEFCPRIFFYVLWIGPLNKTELKLNTNDRTGPTSQTGALTANKAGRFQNLLFFLLFAPQVSKCVDDDTKDEVEDDDDDHEEEEQVVDYSGSKQRLLSTKNTGFSTVVVFNLFITILFNWH